MSLYPRSIFGLRRIISKSRSGKIRVAPYPPCNANMASTLSSENISLIALARAASSPARYPLREKRFSAGFVLKPKESTTSKAYLISSFWKAFDDGATTPTNIPARSLRGNKGATKLLLGFETALVTGRNADEPSTPTDKLKNFLR